MRLRLLSVGKDRSGLFSPAVAEYSRRIAHYVRLELVEVPEARDAAGTPRAREEEAGAILRRVAPRERLVALDERGKEYASIEFARRLQAWMAEGRDVTVVVGGAEGLAQEVLGRADEIVALSRMTLPHRLARVVVLEQIYRGLTLLRGEPYHK